MDMTVTSDLVTSNGLFDLNNNGDLLFRLSDTEKIKVTSSLCFPWMKNDEFISIRDTNLNEVFLIKRLTQLDETSRQAVEESLLTATFMLKIIQVKEIKAEFEIRSWSVVTEQGIYKFQTHIDYWPQVFNETTILIRDVTGNIFYIDDPQTLDDKSYHLMWPYLD